MKKKAFGSITTWPIKNSGPSFTLQTLPRFGPGAGIRVTKESSTESWITWRKPSRRGSSAASLRQCNTPGSSECFKRITSTYEIVLITLFALFRWDFPNGWPPLQHMVVVGLESTGNARAQELAFSLAQRWLVNNYEAYQQSMPNAMFEKVNIQPYATQKRLVYHFHC